MKKLIVFFAIMLFGAVAFGQRSISLSPEVTYGSHMLPATETITGVGSFTYEVFANKHVKTTQDLKIVLDSLKTPRASVQLKGKKFASDAYTNIGTATAWKGTSSDTSIIVSNTSANRYRYYAVTVTSDTTGVGATAKLGVRSLEWKLWLE